MYVAVKLYRKHTTRLIRYLLLYAKAEGRGAGGPRQ